MARVPRQIWGVEKFAGYDAAGGVIELSVYGRDASDARILAKLWRFCFYRDSGPTLILDRLQQVGHEAFLTLMAGRAGIPVPEVLAVGRFGPSQDAALVTRLPAGQALLESGDADLPDTTVDGVLRTVLALREAGIAHGALGSETIVVSAAGDAVLKDFRRASSSAPASRLDGDLAAVLAAIAMRVGTERTAAAVSWIVIGVVVAAGIAALAITVVPRVRRLARARIWPHLVSIWANIKTIATEPRKIVYILAGSLLAQLFVALALGASLHAVGQRASIATLLVVITLASVIGGAIPVPGGMGVVEAGLIGGLTSIGVPQDQAVAAVFIQRLFTAYLPPIWGWVTLAWMRRREYV